MSRGLVADGLLKPSFNFRSFPCNGWGDAAFAKYQHVGTALYRVRLATY